MSIAKAQPLQGGQTGERGTDIFLRLRPLPAAQPSASLLCEQRQINPSLISRFSASGEEGARMERLRSFAH